MVGGRKLMGLAPPPLTLGAGFRHLEPEVPMDARAAVREPGPPGRAESPHPRPSRAGLRGGAHGGSECRGSASALTPRVTSVYDAPMRTVRVEEREGGVRVLTL